MEPQPTPRPVSLDAPASAGVPSAPTVVSLPGSVGRSEEHTSDSSHLGISYAVFCLKKKINQSDTVRFAIRREGCVHIRYSQTEHGIIDRPSDTELLYLKPRMHVDLLLAVDTARRSVHNKQT